LIVALCTFMCIGCSNDQPASTSTPTPATEANAKPTDETTTKPKDDIHAYAADEPRLVKPKIEGRPVCVVAGKVVVFPEGVDEPPGDYRGSIGVRPLALIKFEDRIVGEVFVAPLQGTAVDESKGMAASAEKDDAMKLLTLQKEKDRHYPGIRIA